MLWLSNLSERVSQNWIARDLTRDSRMLIERCNRRAISQVLDLLAEDDRLNVYAGELEVRPPGAPTTGQAARLSSRLGSVFFSPGCILLLPPNPHASPRV